MKTETLSVYLLNCLLFLVPIMSWNLVFASRLPRGYSREVFEKDIPPFVLTGENIFRLLVFILPVLMPLRVETQSQRVGLWFYLAGTVIYFISWLVQIYFPQSAWSISAFGFLAPAYTPLIWLLGVGLIGDTLYFASPYQSWMYISLSVIFVGFHLSHTAIVYLKNFKQHVVRTSL